ncbi:hypothetical protein ABK734_05330 [Enterobacter sp. KE9933]|uniref:hypothetical protein n=1 Tax=Enterobacter sp. KE9933 TaxID=3118153 RepID=UPI003751253B
MHQPVIRQGRHDANAEPEYRFESDRHTQTHYLGPFGQIEAITSNVITTMNLIRDISQATQNAKNDLAQKGETRIVYIRQALEGDPCANQLVPSAAADSLREYADSLRSGPSGADKR